MELKVEKRDVFGKQLKPYRAEGKIPGIIYSKHLESSIPVFFDKMEFLRTYDEAGHSSPVTLKGDGINEMVLIHEIDADPVKDRLQHVDFHAVKADEEVEAEVAIVTYWEPPVEKQGLGKVEVLRDTVLVEALPNNLPHDVQIDLSKIESQNDIIFIKDLDFWEKVEIKDDLEQPVVTVVEIEEESEEEEEDQQAVPEWINEEQ